MRAIMTRCSHWTFVLLFTCASACAFEVSDVSEAEDGHRGDEDVARTYQALTTTATLRGYLTFAPDYKRSNGSTIAATLGQIPPNTDQSAALPHLFVCAIDRDGTEDSDPVFGSQDDDVLGCARADSDGYYDMQITATGSDAGDDVYLVTWFCDDADGPVTVIGSGEVFEDDAEVCVRMNMDVTQAGHRKFVRSPMRTIVYGGTSYLNWNLSCPAKTGSSMAASEISCTNAEEEPTLTGATNSSRAWNKEFTHVFRSAIEPVKTFGNLKPKTSEVGTTGCGASGSSACTPCSTGSCQDEINLHVTPATVAGIGTKCSTSASINTSSGYRDVCMIHGSDGRSGTHNPFRAVHEIGHNLHRRWMKDSSDVGQDCGTSGWSTGNDESGATAEGWANFVAVASWWNAGMAGMEYDGRDVTSAGDADLAGSCGSGTTCTCSTGGLNGEGRVTQFFVDLWDVDDSMDLSFADLLRVWSTFDQDAESDECGPDGRNLLDFRSGYDQLRAAQSWPSLATYDSVATPNCVHLHSNSTEPARPAGSTTCGGC